MYAVIRNGGHQYRVSEGETIEVERLDVEAGASYTFDEVLMVGEGDSFRTFRIGLFGLDKLKDVPGTLARLDSALKAVAS